MSLRTKTKSYHFGEWDKGLAAPFRKVTVDDSLYLIERGLRQIQFRMSVV